MLKPPSSDLRPFHVLAIQGRPKSGKTGLAVGAPDRPGVPGKVAIQSTDNGWDGLIQEYPDYQERFLVENYIMEASFEADYEQRSGDRQAMEQAAERQADKVMNQTWRPLVRDAKDAFHDPAVRTLIWDLADGVNEIIRMANFGKLERNPQLTYGLVNAEYKAMILQAHKTRTNMVLIHTMKPKYKTIRDGDREKSVRDADKYERAGNESADYLIHSLVETSYNPAAKQPYAVKIIMSRLAPWNTGQVLESPDWVTLMGMLHPQAPPEAWL